MTDYSTLTMSPNLVTYNNSPVFQRRSSIRRGTIASISKDIRVNDVTEIIKTQKALIQKERVMNDTQSTMLKRRHSMMNMSNKVQQQQPKKQLPSRMRTLSIGDLKNTDTFTTDASAKLRLDERAIKAPEHPRKCTACIAQQQDVAPTESMPSMSSNNSSTSSLASSTSSLRHSSLHHEIIKNLNYGIANYSHQIQDLISQPIEKKQQQIKECKALIVQQQQLLNQLEALVVNDEETSTACSNNSTKNDDHDIEPKKQPSHLLALFSSTPKASTTQVVIRQKADKKEADTIFSVQGICTTVESSYIPDQLLSNKEAQDQKNGVYQYRYSLNLTFGDRQDKFMLKPQQEWEKDDQAHVCHDQHCQNKFSWLQRKHHCRGCGQIYCNTHSGNRLPLFTKDASADKPTFSRVCDHCFFSLAADALESF